MNYCQEAYIDVSVGFKAALFYFYINSVSLEKLLLVSPYLPHISIYTAENVIQTSMSSIITIIVREAIGAIIMHSESMGPSMTLCLMTNV